MYHLAGRWRKPEWGVTDVCGAHVGAPWTIPHLTAIPSYPWKHSHRVPETPEGSQKTTVSQTTWHISFHICLPSSPMFSGPLDPRRQIFSETDPWVYYVQTKSYQPPRGREFCGYGVTTVEKNSWFYCIYLYTGISDDFLINIHQKSSFCNPRFSLLSPVLCPEQVSLLVVVFFASECSPKYSSDCLVNRMFPK